jgi:cell wall assembly regulator SMI1
MKKIWNEIDTWLRRNAPVIFANLRPGALDTDIEKTQRTLSCKLSDSVIRSYRIHDGMRGGTGPLIAGWRLLPLTAIIREWRAWKKLSEEGTFDGMEGDTAAQIKSDWWNPKWIPIGSNGSGDFVCVDLDPSGAGTSGQIISLFHAEATRELIASNFASWLAEFADDLERGSYELREGWLAKAG